MINSLTLVAPISIRVSEFSERMTCALGITVDPEGEQLHTHEGGGQLYCLLDTAPGTVRIAITAQSAVLEVFIPDAVMGNLAAALPSRDRMLGITGRQHEDKEEVISFRDPDNPDQSAMTLEVLLKHLATAVEGSYRLMFAPYTRGTSLGCEDLEWHHGLRGYVLQ